MRDVSSRQVNNCFEYVAATLLAAEAEGATGLVPGLPVVELMLLPAYSALLGGMPPREVVLAAMRADGITDTGSPEAFRWLGSRWGQFEAPLRPWELTSSRDASARL